MATKKAVEPAAKMKALLRKVDRLQTQIRQGETEKVKQLVSTRDAAYRLVRWLDTDQERGEALDQIEAIPFAETLEAARAIEAGRLQAKLSLAGGKAKDHNPEPGTYEYELRVYGVRL